MPESLAEAVIPTLITAGVTLLIAVGGWVVHRWSTTATQRQQEKAQAIESRRVEIEGLKAANEAWEQLNEPILKRLDRLEEKARILAEQLEATRATLDETRTALDETQDILSDSLDLNLEYQLWVESGATPPPPTPRTKRLKIKLDHLRH